ncbi:bifunctional 5,10-methylenetetrahydrofolate dehydrogenase/5,10-methenyltetrahydrofolate cyclohydrolase [Candidatus Dojkabacteria bacterium]|uniref:Bifunctional protein FolD n=1 Tax=Candidatus Dojkabacteria bacterium TaxID=2099670 RepID=A0A847ESY4_9BACT|nr:bifunctional 5,10-methylenetetrahydrofolate dehydrogenase/5,10-methenyltetrahydrofolate cyclohydrolase [Candidatus Dojkabacteria bacterium]
MKILDGKQTAQSISNRLKEEISKYLTQGKRAPKIDIILVGDDYASKMYVDMKSKKALDLGIQVNVHTYPKDISQEQVESVIKQLNEDINIDGIMVKLPLPNHIQESKILELISPDKDVDGLTSTNLGKLFKNDSSAIAPATAKGVIELLKEYRVQIEGKRAVVIGRGDISGLPISAMLQNENATVTICHSRTQNLKEICSKADILVSSIGRAEYINSEYVKEGSIVVDIGTNRNAQGKLVGDIDFNSVKDIAEYITPVPGGIGPMTIVCLFDNLIEAYKKNV